MRYHQYSKLLVIVVSALVLSWNQFVNAGTTEPTIKSAQCWWVPQHNVWTPIGWPNHYFRFNVIYNGTVVDAPCPLYAIRPHALPFLGKNLQLDFCPSEDGSVPPLPKHHIALWRTDGGVGDQSWDPGHATPILRSYWRLQEGLVLREEIFSHVLGGKAVVTGIEPHFAWIRLSVCHVDELRAPSHFGIGIRLSQVYLRHDDIFSKEGSEQENGTTIGIHPSIASLPKALSCKFVDANAKRSLQVLDDDNDVRLIVLPTAPGKVQFERIKGVKNVYGLNVHFACKVGDYVDLLMPALPTAPNIIDAELKVGRDRALAESDAMWEHVSSSKTRFEVPEPLIDNVIARSLKFAEILGQKDYQTGDYSGLSGSWGYDALWSTPTSMVSDMFLDYLGYHKLVAQRLEEFRKYQGTGKPPGPGYTKNAGYFSSPPAVAANNWLSDHGAILYQASEHALLTDNAAFIKEWTDPIVKACDFIKINCARPDPDGVAGLLPSAVATDEMIPTQAVWNLAWNYKGLETAVRFLKRIHHPRATEFETFAAQYKATFQKAFRERAAALPQWTDPSGTKHPMLPTTFSKGPMPHHPFSDAFYLDTGPMVCVWAGLFNADDPLMRSSVQFFREGPNVALRPPDPYPNPLWRPVLDHEISTCEPCYSWNVFHSWQLGDRQHFLEGMYALFTGALSPQTYISCEHRNGIYGNLFATPVAFDLARLALIDDQIAPDELHLLRMCPLAWLIPGKPTILKQMPTEFGDVDLSLICSADYKTLDVHFHARWRHKPARFFLHVPPLPGLAEIRVNGVPVRWIVGKPIQLTVQ